MGIHESRGNSSLKAWIRQVKVWVHKDCLRIHCRKKGIHSYHMNSQSLSNEATPSCCESIIKSEFTHSEQEFMQNHHKFIEKGRNSPVVAWIRHAFRWIQHGCKGIHCYTYEFIFQHTNYYHPQDELPPSHHEFNRPGGNSPSMAWIRHGFKRIHPYANEFIFHRMNSCPAIVNSTG